MSSSSFRDGGNGGRPRRANNNQRANTASSSAAASVIGSNISGVPPPLVGGKLTKAYFYPSPDSAIQVRFVDLTDQLLAVDPVRTKTPVILTHGTHDIINPHLSPGDDDPSKPMTDGVTVICDNKNVDTRHFIDFTLLIKIATGMVYQAGDLKTQQVHDLRQSLITSYLIPPTPACEEVCGTKQRFGNTPVLGMLMTRLHCAIYAGPQQRWIYAKLQNVLVVDGLPVPIHLSLRALGLIPELRSHTLPKFAKNTFPKIPYHQHPYWDKQNRNKKVITNEGKSLSDQIVREKSGLPNKLREDMVCAYCGKCHLNLKEQIVKRYECQKCKCVIYCSKACQRADWPRHKVELCMKICRKHSICWRCGKSALSNTTTTTTNRTPSAESIQIAGDILGELGALSDSARTSHAAAEIVARLLPPSYSEGSSSTTCIPVPAPAPTTARSKTTTTRRTTIQTRTKVCGGCDVVCYCSTACQKQHWSHQHKHDCAQFHTANRTCNYCQTVCPPGQKMEKCNDCRLIKYCSLTCRKLDLPYHRNACRVKRTWLVPQYQDQQHYQRGTERRVCVYYTNTICPAIKEYHQQKRMQIKYKKLAQNMRNNNIDPRLLMNTLR